MKILNIFKEFKKDFGIAVFNDVQKANKKINFKLTAFYMIALGMYIFSKPIYITLIGNAEKKFSLNKLKEEGQFICKEE